MDYIISIRFSNISAGAIFQPVIMTAILEETTMADDGLITAPPARSGDGPARTRLLWLLCGLALVGAALTAPGWLLGIARFVAENLLLMLPVIAFAVGLSAYVRASGADAQIARIFSGGRWRMLLVAALIGAITPVCGVGVLPIIAGLLAAGVPLAPVVAFWLASPITDPAMLTVTVGTLGLGLALAKTLAAVAIGLLGGLATLAIQGAGGFADPLKPNRFAASAGCASSCDGGLTWRPWRDPARRRRLLAEARAAAQTMLIWLSLAFALEAVLRQVLPPELIAGLVGGDSPWAIPLAVLVGTPIYLDGYAALPLVRGLIELGMSPGAALAFLVSGGITSAYASVAVFALVRWSVFLGYLGMAVLGSIGAGFAYALAVTAMG